MFRSVDQSVDVFVVGDECELDRFELTAAIKKTKRHREQFSVTFFVARCSSVSEVVPTFPKLAKANLMPSRCDARTPNAETYSTTEFSRIGGGRRRRRG